MEGLCRSSADDTQQQVRGAHEANLCTAVPRRTHDRKECLLPPAPRIFLTWSCNTSELRRSYA